MTVLKIYKYPHPVLRELCQPVTTFDDALRQIVADMVDTMYNRTGSVGLAAPQVGHPIRLFVMDVNAATTKDALRVLINPVVTQSSRNKIVREGCLSFPDYLANVRRATKITVQAHDPHGNLHEFEARHLEAVCIQHEIDHLDGVLMIDRIASLKTDWIRRTGGMSNADSPESPKATDGGRPDPAESTSPETHPVPAA